MGLKELTASRLIKGGILVFWAVMIALLIQKAYFPGRLPLLTAVSAGEAGEKEQWYGIYLKGQKIGNSHTRTQTHNQEIVLQDETFLKLTLLGIPRELKISTQGKLSSDFALQSFEFRLTSYLVDFKARGEVIGKRLFVKVTSGGVLEDIAVDFDKPPILWTALTPSLLSKGAEVGKTYRLPIFNPSTLSLQNVTVQVVGHENLQMGESTVAATILRSEFGGLESRSWIDSSGDILKEESPMGLTTLRESQEQALRPEKGRSVVDLLTVTAASSSKIIPNPRELQRLRVKLKNISTNHLTLAGGRQDLRGEVLSISREIIPTNPVSFPFGGSELERFLKPEPFIQSDHPLIRENAKSIVGKETDAVKATNLLMNWVYKSVQKVPTVSIPSAVDVLQTLRGDCNEHAVLFTALSRAAGIPSRIVAGIIYHEGKFYYHAWSENYVGRWIAIDPLLNQMPADATHIKLVEGNLDQQVPLMGVIGRLRVDVVDYK
ncbi:MAG TPA: transglutaminase-like domain-containing protein [bacterium]|nr:transglutaminase-like domain-containing protein [bacterium]